MRKVSINENPPTRVGTQAHKIVTITRVLRELHRLRTRSSWSRGGIERHQQKELASLRAFAYANSPFYQQFHRGLFNAPLSELPVLTKRLVMDNFDRLVTDPKINLEEARNYLSLTAQAQNKTPRYLGRYEIAATSGSSGSPGIFLFNEQEWVTVMASFGRAREWAGQRLDLTRRSKMAVVSSTNDKNISARVGKAADSWFLPTLRLDATRPLDQLVGDLNRWQPEVLVAYASMAYFLAHEQLAGNLTIHPGKVFTSSEVTTRTMREITEKAWGKVIFDEYAATETATIGAECRQHHGLHLFEDLLIIENVDEHNRPVPVGVFGAKLLVTALFNRSQPLIRYEISDRVKLSEIPSASSSCGLGYPLIEAIEGRREDILVMAGKDQSQVQLYPNVFTDLLDTLPNQGWQINQQEDGSLQVLLVEGNPAVEEDAVRARLGKTLVERGVAAPKIEGEKVGAILKAASGKSPLIRAYYSEGDHY